MSKYYYIKRKKIAPLPEAERGMREDSIIVFREEAAEKRELSVWGLLLWLFRSLFLLLLVVVFLLGGTIVKRGAALVQEELSDRALAAQSSLEDGLKMLSRGNLEEALVNFKLARANLAYAVGTLYGLGQGFSLVANLPYYRFGASAKGELLVAAGELTEGGSKALNAAQGLQTAFNEGLISFMPAGASETKEPSRQLGELKQEMTAANGLIKQGQERWQRLFASYDPEVQNYLKRLQPKVAFAASVSALGEKLIAGLPDLLGFTQPKDYLLLFQNSNELRPTGGFIGTLGLLRLSRGRVESLTIEDVHQKDGQLRSFQLEPPEPLQGMTDYWGIRDANFNPNFLASSKIIRQLYEKAGGGSVDGVIALTPELLQEFLRLTGPLYVGSRNTILKAENVIALLEQDDPEAARLGLPNPGKELMREATPLLLRRLESADLALKKELGQLLLTYLHQKEILLALDNPSIAQVVSALHFDGALAALAPGSDYLLISRANLGGRKSSQNILGQYNYQITVADNSSLQASLALLFRHQGSYSFPDGSNREFIRLYLPLGSRLLGMVGQDGEEKIEETIENNLSVLSFWLTTEPGQEKEVIVNYELPFKLDFRQGKTVYHLYLEKQPGLQNTILTAKLQLPKDWIAYAEDPFSREGGTLTLFKGEFTADLKRTITVER